MKMVRNKSYNIRIFLKLKILIRMFKLIKKKITIIRKIFNYQGFKDQDKVSQRIQTKMLKKDLKLIKFNINNEYRKKIKMRGKKK